MAPGALRARPSHVLLLAAAIGLALGPRAPWLVLGVVPALPLICPSVAWSVAAASALLCGIVGADLRLESLEGRVGPASGHVRAQLMLLESPRAERTGWRALAELEHVPVLLRVREGPAPAMRGTGELVVVSAHAAPPAEREHWLRPRHVRAVLIADRVTWTGKRRGGPWGAVDAVRRRASQALNGRLAAPDAALLRGMVLGDDAALSLEDRDRLRASGLGHLVAASGANVALLATLVLAGAAALGLGHRSRLLLVLGLVALYVPLAGGGPSIRRAGVMGAAAIVAALASRPAARWHALLLAAVVTLALDPLGVEDVGWQLSFASVAAIALLAAPLAGVLGRRGIPRAAAQAAALTIAASLGTAPIAAAAFGTVPVAGLVANLLVAPVVAPVTWLGMLAAFVGQVAPTAAAALCWPAGPPLAWIMAVGAWTAELPGSRLAASPWLVLALCAMSAAAVLSARARRAALVVAPVALVLGSAYALVVRASPPAPPAVGSARVSFLDVGQGDATLVQSARAAVLVDAGPPGGPIVRRLREVGISRLDALVGTHAQADHLGGADAVVRALPVGVVLDGRDGLREREGTELAMAAATAGVRLVAPVAGDVLRVKDLELRVLWPPARGDVGARGDPNDRAIVLLVRGPGLRVLLGADAESHVLARLDPGPVDVLKVSHHGSADPGLRAVLERLRPRLAVIEVGAGNGYGHPAPSTLAALRAASVPTLRTDRDGTVRVDSVAGALSVRSDAGVMRVQGSA
ncbi:MAG: ComEC/Rec2 family competence protein [Solirubrobacteraceae bacterium]|nr:ComEC/Rec2 family competence protein [Solirubrobacteraceae bacterium]